MARFLVEALDVRGRWRPCGSVLLPFDASYVATERALSAVGVYAPRGADKLDWLDLPEGRFGVVREYGRRVAVRMTEILRGETASVVRARLDRSRLGRGW